MKGIVKKICGYLNIQQIVTGGHNPRGNAICERANQTVGNIHDSEAHRQGIHAA